MSSRLANLQKAFQPATDGLQEDGTGLGQGAGDGELDGALCVDAELRQLNITAAVALGITVGDAAIRQILSGGAGPLGERGVRSHAR